MRDGLDFAEDYVDAGVSDVIEMLFGSGKDDVAGYAEARTLRHPPGTRFNYSSGTSNIVAAIAGRCAGGGAAFVDLLRGAVFDAHRHDDRPIRGSTTQARSSARRTCTRRHVTSPGSVCCTCGTARGTVSAMLPAGWVDHARRLRSVDEEGNGYGAHWWVVDDDQGSFRASGYEGQAILICPGLDLIAVRLGHSTAEQYRALKEWRAAVVDWAR